MLWGNVIENTWTGPFYPNASTNWCDTCPLDCGTQDKPTCLFNVLTDPTEHVNLAASEPAILKNLTARLGQLQATVFNPGRGTPSQEACKAGLQTWKGFVGPFLP